MTREEQIKAANPYDSDLSYQMASDPEEYFDAGCCEGFKEGAEWADAHHWHLVSEEGLPVDRNAEYIVRVEYDSLYENRLATIYNDGIIYDDRGHKVIGITAWMEIPEYIE